MIRFTAAIFVCFLLVATGLVHGWVWGRWTQSINTGPLDNVLPPHVGQWDSYSPPNEAELDLPPKSGETARVIRHYRRKFDDAASVSVLLVRGESAPMVYNPLICYDSSGFSRFGQPRRRQIAGSNDELWEVDLAKPGTATVLRIRWAWSLNGTWQIPDSPRWTFLRSREIYKLYIVTKYDVVPSDDAADPSLTFLAEFVAALRTTLPSLEESPKP